MGHRWPKWTRYRKEIYNDDHELCALENTRKMLLL